MSLQSNWAPHKGAPALSTSDNDLTDVLQGILVERITVGEAGDLQVDGLLVIVLGLVGANLALHVKGTNLTSDTVELLPLC